MSRSGKMIRNKRKFLIVLSVLIGIVALVGVSYALWIANFNQTDENLVSASCFQIEFREDTESISLQNTFPITDEEGKTLTPYTFTITNTCESYASYQVNLEVLNTSTLTHYEYIKVALEDDISLLSDNDTVNTTLDNATTSFKLKTGYLDHNESVTYNLRLWIDENVTLESEGILNTTFASKITITASYIDHMPSDYEQCVDKYGEDSIQCSILADADTEGCPTVNDDGTVQVTSGESTNGYLCSAPDDYGTSYYYRGNVENNWVKFGGYYWRILRINGDGSIRMIYAGDASVIDALSNKSDILKNGYNDGSTDYTQIGTSRYNSRSDNNAYVGYMYGTPGSTTYEATHANTNDSTIKTYLDNWYKINIEDKGLSSYVSDTLFCNDRSVFSGTGIGTSYTQYRWSSSSNGIRLTCSNQNDRFTVDDEETGNGDLTYPIGLVNTDEVYLVGGHNYTNYGYYLYTGNEYWTMSPNYFTGSNATVRFVYSNSYASDNYYVGSSSGVRPVINLKANSLTSGDGTANNPYVVEG